MNQAYLAAGLLALTGAIVHGGLGEMLVVRRIDPTTLPGTRFGGGTASLRMIRGAWHMVTLSFVGSGLGLTTCAVRDSSAACDGVGMLAAGLFSGYAAIAIVIPLVAGRPGALVRHPAPVLLTLVSVLAWMGAA